MSDESKVENSSTDNLQAKKETKLSQLHRQENYFKNIKQKYGLKTRKSSYLTNKLYVTPKRISNDLEDVSSLLAKFESPSDDDSSASHSAFKDESYNNSHRKTMEKCNSKEQVVLDKNVLSSVHQRRKSSSVSRSFDDDDKEEVESFSREECLEMYKILVHQKYILQKINILLQKKVYDYCKEKKLETYFEEETADLKADAKYYKQLKAFDEFLISEEINHKNSTEELLQLEDETDEAEEIQNQYLETFLEKQKEIAGGLISEKNGKPLPEKDLDNLLIKQRMSISELANIRLNYIKLRDMVLLKETAVKNLETFGKGLHLVDYEDLKMENQNYNNKIDQFDEELFRRRKKAVESLKSLANLRKKANALDYDVEDLNRNIQAIQIEEKEVMNYFGRLKVQKREIHEKRKKLQEEAGLLIHDHLIKDFENNIEESQALAAEIENLKNNYHVQSQRLLAVKEFTCDARRCSAFNATSR